MTSISIPSSVTSIEEGAFGLCSKLTSITIPVSVTSIGAAFYGCSGLTTLYANSSVPVDLSAVMDVFTNVNTNSCKLIVPYQSKALYAAASQWKNFKNIEEAASGLSLDVNHLEYDAAKHSYTFGISANVQWTVSAEQPWITFDIPSGDGDQNVTLTLEANTGTPTRKGQITVSAPEVTAQIITVTQEGLPATFTIIAGGLLTTLSDEELKGITSLTLEGTIDARDFKTIRDEMPLLSFLDLSRTTIVAYTGTEGTKFNSFYTANYPANAIPYSAFYNETNNNDHFETIVLPLNITSIGESAFGFCHGLTSLVIPQGVTEIAGYAFINCINLTSISLASSVTTIGAYAFTECKSLVTVDLPSALAFINEFLFTDCYHLASITIPSSVTEIKGLAFAGCKSLTSITIPSSVEKIDHAVFSWCTGLESVYIPASVKWIGEGAFEGCTSLKAIYTYRTTPIVYQHHNEVFFNVNKDSCILYVPSGSKALYAEAYQWKDFKNIVEMTTGIDDLKKNMTPFKCYPNPFSQQVSIEIQNPKHIKLTVDIYNMAGQRVKNLTMENTSELLNLSWNGTNEKGQQVLPGAYICRMNKQTRQLVLLK